jgi:hypothetical protein
MEIQTSGRKLNKRKRRMLKIKEYKGDSLAKLIAVMIFDDVESVNRLCSNKILGEAAKKLELEEMVVDFSYRGVVKENKGLANAYEIKLWEVFEAYGLESAISFFKDTALVAYEESLP